MPKTPSSSTPSQFLAGLQSIHDTGPIAPVGEIISPDEPSAIKPGTQPTAPEPSTVEQLAITAIASPLIAAGVPRAQAESEAQEIYDQIEPAISSQALRRAADAYPMAVTRASGDRVRQWLRNQAQRSEATS